MKAYVVIGANFGDEGKGLMTDYLCAKHNADIVVRFNGGCQAGHTVVAPNGKRHVHQHFGSGTIQGIPTYLSQFFIVNPIMFFKEFEELSKLGINPTVYAHPACLVTTFADMIINQRIEDARGDKRHGSVGLGIYETQNRATVPQLKITMGDLWNGIKLQSKLKEICTKYAKFRTGKEIDNHDDMIDKFIKGCETFANAINPLGIAQCKNPVFEGAQGLLLDQNNKEFYPHLTRSNTGMQNVRVLCGQAGIKDIEAYYVSRTYLTRHGAGPLPNHNPNMSFEDDTNVAHSYQGIIRFAPLDSVKLIKRCDEDFGGYDWKLVLTHCDQLKEPTDIKANFLSFGKTRNDIEELK